MTTEEAFTLPPVPVSPETESPGGIGPVMLKDCGGVCAPVTVIPIGVVMGTPMVVRYGLVMEATSWVAPARECTAPRDPSAATAAFKTAPAGDSVRICPALAAMRTTGVRWRSMNRNTVGTFSQGSRRWRRGKEATGVR